MEASVKLWIQKCERLRNELKKALDAMNCMREQSAANSRHLTLFSENEKNEKSSVAKISK